MRRHIPNLLTAFRMVAAPCVALVFVVLDRPAADLWAVSLFVAAAVTDWLDGKLARAWNVQSAFGTMLDPIADKTMTVIALTVLLGQHGLLPGLVMPAAIIITREIMVSGLREYLGDVKLPVTWLAKWKTGTQLVALTLLLAVAPVAAFDTPSSGEGPQDGAEALVMVLGQPLLWLAAALTAITGWDYSRKAVAYLRAGRQGTGS
jgi:CDP-diacylglycerol--glycerol-3-phosphate 3-phosphatidyltransferase